MLRPVFIGLSGGFSTAFLQKTRINSGKKACSSAQGM